MDLHLTEFADRTARAFHDAALSRDYLKLAARHRAVGDNAKAEAFRAVAATMGSDAIDQLTQASSTVAEIQSALQRILDDQSVRNYARKGQFRIQVDRVLADYVKPSLLKSSMTPEQISYIWRDINDFLMDVEREVGEKGINGIPLPNLAPAITNLRNVDYKDQNWGYCDQMQEGKEPIPLWKDVWFKTMRQVSIIVGFVLALISCNWELVPISMSAWVAVEEMMREFCGWVCI